MEPFRFKSDLRNHQAIVQPRLYDCLMVTQITQPRLYDCLMVTQITQPRLYDCLMVTQITLLACQCHAQVGVGRLHRHGGRSGPGAGPGRPWPGSTEAASE